VGETEDVSPQHLPLLEVFSLGHARILHLTFLGPETWVKYLKYDNHNIQLQNIFNYSILIVLMMMINSAFKMHYFEA